MPDNRMSLQEAINHPGVDSVIFAECGGRTLRVEQVRENLYTLDELQTFDSVESLERTIQEHYPSYRKDACIWYDQWTNTGGNDAANV